MKNPFLFKKQNGFYYIAYYDANNSRRSFTTKTKNKSKAQVIFTEFIGNGKKQFNQAPIICSDLFEEYLDISKPPNKTLKTYTSIISACNEFLRLAGDKLINQYTTKDIDKVLSKKVQESSIHTAKRIQKTIKAIFNQAIKWGYLSVNPFDNSMKIKIPENDPLFLSKSDFKRLQEATESPLYRDIFVFAIYTGLRLNELINLKLNHIDLDTMSITVMSNDESRTKSGKTRHVELAKSMTKIVEKYRIRNLEYLFESPRTNTKMDSRTLQKITKDAMIAAGLNPKLSFHNFRKTFGKWLLDASGDLKYVSQQLGHSSISVTEKHYAKYLKQEFKGHINKIKL